MDQDRVAGVLLGAACGDALGAGYEFGPPLPPDEVVTMRGGNGFAPGEWTDDTALTIAIAQACVDGHDLRDEAGLDAVAAGFLRWYADGPTDIGNQTRAVFDATGSGGGAGMARAAGRFYADNPRGGAGNGALMRTAPVALAYLEDPAGLVEAARAMSALTHADPYSLEACALWSVAIRHAVLEGSLDGLRIGLTYLPGDRVGFWADRLAEAEAGQPSDFDRNGWVVQALQGAWSAIVNTPIPADEPARHFELALAAAVRGGRDTDTVAAIAGALLGARWGAAAVPREWREAIFGWPGYRADDLVALARGIAA